jgi:hypothetical protein
MVFDASDRLFACRSGYVWVQDQPQLAGYYHGYMPNFTPSNAPNRCMSRTRVMLLVSRTLLTRRGVCVALITAPPRAITTVGIHFERTPDRQTRLLSVQVIIPLIQLNSWHGTRASLVDIGTLTVGMNQQAGSFSGVMPKISPALARCLQL